jgi:hypothetical protein
MLRAAGETTDHAADGAARVVQGTGTASGGTPGKPLPGQAAVYHSST